MVVMATKFPAPERPLIPARHKGGSQTPKAIVVHATVSPDKPGTARSIAEWWNGPTSPVTSAHYITDPNEDIQAVGDHTIAYHCGYNNGSIGHELCDEQTGPASRWQDANSQAILRRAARLDAELCLAYGIEPRRPSVAELQAKGPHGIYGHNDSRLAFGNTTHTDPRDFPWAQYLDLVNKEVANIKAAQKVKPGKHKKVPGARRITSQNVKHLPLMTPDQVKHDIRLTLQQSDIVGWQEMQNDHHYYDELIKAEKGVWETYTGAGKAVPGQVEKTDDPEFDPYYSTPISWRTALFDFVEGDRFLLNPGSTGISGNRYCTWVRLRDKATGVEFTVVNVHMVVGSHSTKYADHAKRLAIWTKAFAKLVKFVAGIKGPVVITGDFNGVGSTLRPRPAAWKVLFGPRIDHIILVGKWSRKGKKVLRGRFSDHQAVRVSAIPGA